MPYPALSLDQAHAKLTAPGAPFETVAVEIRGERQRVWKNAPSTLREVFLQGRSHGERTYLVYEDERATFSAFARAAVVFAHELQGLGVDKGDRVAIGMRNVPEWPVVFFGALLAGAIAVPLNAWSTGAELEYILQDSGARLAVFDAERFDRIRPHLDALPALKVALVGRAQGDFGDSRAEPLERLIGRTADWPSLPALDLPEVALSPDDDATIFYTSGTTGKPKGALGTHRNAISTLIARPYGMSVAALRRGEAPVAPDPTGPQKSALLSVPFFHVTGCMSTLIPCLFFGLKLVTMRRWDAGEALKVIEREKISGAGGVPTIAWQLIEHPDFAKYDTSSLENFSYGGAPAAADLVRRLKSASPSAALVTAWGMTETSAPFTIVFGEDYETRPTTCGYCMPIGEMRVVGPNGEARPNGEAGELWVRGPMVVKGYWRNPDATEQTFGGGWLRDRRHRQDRRRGLLLHRRPRQGHADPRRRKHLLRRGRERARRAPGRDRRGGRRASASRTRRGAGRGGDGEGGFVAGRAGATRLRRRARGRVQGAGQRSRAAGDAAEERQRQNHETGIAQAVRGVIVGLSR